MKKVLTLCSRIRYVLGVICTCMIKVKQCVGDKDTQAWIRERRRKWGNRPVESSQIERIKCTTKCSRTWFEGECYLHLCDKSETMCPRQIYTSLDPRTPKEVGEQTGGIEPNWTNKMYDEMLKDLVRR